MRWLVDVPTVRSDGAHEEVRGVQTFMCDARFRSEVADQVLAEVISEPAIRHRRGAAVDLSRLTVRPWNLGAL